MLTLINDTQYDDLNDDENEDETQVRNQEEYCVVKLFFTSFELIESQLLTLLFIFNLPAKLIDRN